MKKIIAVFLCLAMLAACAAVFAEQEKSEKVSIGKISINGAFDLQCALPDGYSVQPLIVERDQVVALVSSQDAAKPVMYLSVAFDETYADVQRMNDLDADALALLEQTFTDLDPTVDLSYGETGLGTHLLIARQFGEDVDNYVAFLSIYDGYFVEFVLTPPSLNSGLKLSEDYVDMCIEFLTEMDFIPAAEGEYAGNISGKTFPAVLGAYDAASGTLEVTLRAAVTLDGTVINSLSAGDTLTIGDEAVEIVALDTEEDGDFLINDEISLRRQEDGSYKAYFYESEYRTNLATLHLNVPDTLVYTDNIDPESLDMLDEPEILSAADFLAELAANDSIGFAADNVLVTFSEEGELAQVERYYVPWQ